MQGGSKDYVKVACVGVSGHGKKELHRNWGLDTQSWWWNCNVTVMQRKDNKLCKKIFILSSKYKWNILQLIKCARMCSISHDDASSHCCMESHKHSKWSSNYQICAATLVICATRFMTDMKWVYCNQRLKSWGFRSEDHSGHGTEPIGTYLWFHAAPMWCMQYD